MAKDITIIRTVGDLRAALSRFEDGQRVAALWDSNLWEVSGIGEHEHAVILDVSNAQIVDLAVNDRANISWRTS